MPIKLPSFDLDALLGVSDTKVVSTTEEISATNVVSTTPVVNTTETISSTNSVVNTTAVVSTTGKRVVNTTEGVVSTTPEARTQYINNWKRKNRKRLQVELPAEEASRLKAEAARRGLSVTGLVKAAVAEYLEGHPAEEEEG